MQQPEVYIREADKLVDENGKVAGGKGDTLLRTFMTGFAAWVARVGSGKAEPLGK